MILSTRWLNKSINPQPIIAWGDGECFLIFKEPSFMENRLEAHTMLVHTKDPKCSTMFLREALNHLWKVLFKLLYSLMVCFIVMRSTMSEMIAPFVNEFVDKSLSKDTIWMEFSGYFKEPKTSPRFISVTILFNFFFISISSSTLKVGLLPLFCLLSPRLSSPPLLYLLQSRYIQSSE